MGDSIELARAFLNEARMEIKKGGDYRDRLLHSDTLRRLSAVYSNAGAVLEKAEAEADPMLFVMEEMGREYGRLRDEVWQQHNFSHPYYRKGDWIFIGTADVIESIKARFPQMASRLSPEELRTAYVRAAYKWDGEFKDGWEARYGPIKKATFPHRGGA